MYFPTLPLLALLTATTVLSQNLTGLPACAVTCFEDNFVNSACADTNIACLCADKTFFTDVELCVLGGCDTADTESEFLSILRGGVRRMGERKGV
jgi:hypothetical protein